MNRELYCQWIYEVRKAVKKNQKEFGKLIVHYVQKNGVRVCDCYGRTQVSNWERGESVPGSLESFVSIALLEFDKKNPAKEWNHKYRLSRYEYVNEKMKNILGMEFYCRNLHEMLLIQVCRGIINFAEVLTLETELGKIVQNVELDREEQRLHAIEPGTDFIEQRIPTCQTVEDIYRMVRDCVVEFQTGSRSLGERFRCCFEERQRYAEPLSLSGAIQIYAPNYSKSFNRMFEGDVIRREWLLDLCMHLRFSRDEIQYILRRAHKNPLSDNPSDQEFYYKETRDPIGSANWYKKLEQQYPEIFRGHYSGFYPLEVMSSAKRTLLKKKLIISVLLTMYVSEDFKNILMPPPVDYLLESFLLYDHGKEAVANLEKTFGMISGDLEPNMKNLWSQLKKDTDAWWTYIQKRTSDDTKQFLELNVYQKYGMEFQDYYTFSGHETDEIIRPVQVEGARKLRYLSALLYTVMTGKYYDNNLSKKDLAIIKGQLENQVKEWKLIYNFFTWFFITFLNGERLHVNDNGDYYLIVKGKQPYHFNFESIFVNLCESIMILND